MGLSDFDVLILVRMHSDKHEILGEFLKQVPQYRLMCRRTRTFGGQKGHHLHSGSRIRNAHGLSSQNIRGLKPQRKGSKQEWNPQKEPEQCGDGFHGAENMLNSRGSQRFPSGPVVKWI